MHALSVWLEFAVALLLITVAGSRLARSGDVIARRTGLGGTWIGLVLVATVTSLPELITGVSAVVLADAPDIAVGTLLGSCVFNLVIIVILDFLVPGRSFYSRVRQDHVLSASFGIILVGTVGFSILLVGQGWGVALGHVGLYTPIIFGMYLMAMRAVYHHEKDNHVAAAEGQPARDAHTSLRAASVQYALAGLVVVATGIWLPFVGERIAVVMNVHETFVGSLFIALATSLPEVVVTIVALRIGAFDLAMSNLLGSNLFNIAVLVPVDLLYTEAPILSAVSPLHTISAVSAIMMTAIAMVGLIYRPRRLLFRRLAWSSLMLLSLYLFNFYVLYLYGS
ncbi:MAG: sodium:calcium antiporter [Myxococcota bacterium]